MAENVNSPIEMNPPTPPPLVEPLMASESEPAPDHENVPPTSEPVEPAPAPEALTSEPAPQPAEATAFAASEPVEDSAPGDSEPEEPAASAPPPPEAPPEEPPKNRKQWYVVKVQSGREDTIKESIERRVRKEGLEEYFGQIVIPVERFTEVKQDKSGKKVTRTKERKLYPGYLMVEVEYNDRILYLFRETSGVGDFVGAHPHDLMKPPTPMSDKEIQKILGPQGKAAGETPNIPAPPKGMDVGDRIRVTDGTFIGMDGTVKQILEAQGKVQVELTIFGRPVPVELEYYQVEQL